LDSEAIKRLFDVALSAIGLIVVAPVLVVCIAAVKIDSPGPAFYRQVRVGRNGRSFKVSKLRTMSVDADAIGPAVSTSSDPRITRFGRLLRKYKLDELPQLFDVMIGNMSLVGPRPEVPKYVAVYPPATRDKVLSVRPGITDPAAVKFFDEAELLAQSADPERYYVDVILPQKLDLYVKYIESRTFLSDLRVLAETILTIGGRRRDQ